MASYTWPPITTTGSAGTVTSVGLALPSSVFNVGGSPVLSSGTLTGTFKSQPANLVLASPDGSPGVLAPTLGYAIGNVPSTLIKRDSQGNSISNNIITTVTSTASTGGTITLDSGSSFSQILTGTMNETFVLPDASTLVASWGFEFNNDSTGILTVKNAAGTTLFTIVSGGWARAVSLDTASPGTWDWHFFMPANSAYGTAGADIDGFVKADEEELRGVADAGFEGHYLKFDAIGGAVTPQGAALLQAPSDGYGTIGVLDVNGGTFTWSNRPLEISAMGKITVGYSGVNDTQVGMAHAGYGFGNFLFISDGTNFDNSSFDALMQDSAQSGNPTMYWVADNFTLGSFPNGLNSGMWVSITSPDINIGCLNDFNVGGGGALVGSSIFHLTDDRMDLYHSGHIKSTPPTGPSSAPDANAGTSASSALSTATDVAGHLTLTTGSAAWAPGVQVTVTFAKSYVTPPIVVFCAADGATSQSTVARAAFPSSTVNDFSINFPVADTAANAYSWFYHIIETQ